MTRPLALDLFCCAGGIAVGLERAGFDVVGIDWKPSQHWCGAGEVHEADLSTAEAVEAVIRAFEPDFVNASPPCQANSVATGTRARAAHPRLIGSTREGMLRAGVPGMIENVPPTRAARWPEIVRPDVLLCGAMFEDTRRLRRHRHFELLGWFTFAPPHLNCAVRDVVTVCGDNGPTGGKDRAHRRRVMTLAGHAGHGPGQHFGQNRAGVEAIRWREAMGWLDGPKDRYSLAQAIPPAYGEWLGRQFLARSAAAVAS